VVGYGGFLACENGRQAQSVVAGTELGHGQSTYVNIYIYIDQSRQCFSVRGRLYVRMELERSA
jgi:hypothetical protein